MLSNSSEWFARAIFLITSAVMSLIAFIVYGLDKFGAKINDPKKRHTRIPEKLLIALAFACGAPGAALGMIVFHHKIRKTKFITLVPIALIIWIAVWIYLS